MLHQVKFRCGHIQVMALTGQAQMRARKADWYGKHSLCPDCRASGAIADRLSSLPVEPPLSLVSIRLHK